MDDLLGTLFVVVLNVFFPRLRRRKMTLEAAQLRHQRYDASLGNIMIPFDIYTGGRPPTPTGYVGGPTPRRRFTEVRIEPWTRRRPARYLSGWWPRRPAPGFEEFLANARVSPTGESEGMVEVDYAELGIEAPILRIQASDFEIMRDVVLHGQRARF